MKTASLGHVRILSLRELFISVETFLASPSAAAGESVADGAYPPDAAAPECAQHSRVGLLDVPTFKLWLWLHSLSNRHERRHLNDTSRSSTARREASVTLGDSR